MPSWHLCRLPVRASLAHLRVTLASRPAFPISSPYWRCPILDGCVYDIATAVIAWTVIKPVSWSAVSALPSLRLSHCVLNTRKLSVFTMKVVDLVVRDYKDAPEPHTLLPAFPFLYSHQNQVLCFRQPLSIWFVAIGIPFWRQLMTCQSLWLQSRQQYLLLLLILIVKCPSQSPYKV